MKALTVRQPWASLIIKGIKDVENRTWKIPVDTPAYILIQSSSVLDRRAAQYLSHNNSKECAIARQAIKEKVVPPNKDLPCGAILGYVKIKKCVERYPSAWAYPNNYHWVIEEVYEFDKPILNRKGQLGLYNTEFELDKLPPAHLTAKRSIK